ncbi:MAG: hypothetical protein AAF518_05465 [Spirochaetota bacterium]
MKILVSQDCLLNLIQGNAKQRETIKTELELYLQERKYLYISASAYLHTNTQARIRPYRKEVNQELNTIFEDILALDAGAIDLGNRLSVELQELPYWVCYELAIASNASIDLILETDKIWEKQSLIPCKRIIW